MASSSRDLFVFVGSVHQGEPGGILPQAASPVAPKKSPLMLLSTYSSPWGAAAEMAKVRPVRALASPSLALFCSQWVLNMLCMGTATFLVFSELSESVV